MPNLARLPISGSDVNTWSDILNRQITQTTSSANGAFNTFNQFSTRPTSLTADDAGKTYLYTQTGNLHEWSGTEWKVYDTNGVINIKDYGVKCDNSDEGDALQNVVNLTPDGGTLIITGKIVSSKPINISKKIRIDGFTNYIIFTSSNGFKIGSSTGVLIGVTIQNINIQSYPFFEINQNNNFCGIEVFGSINNKSFNHLYENIFCDGFETAFRGNYIWSSNWNNFSTGRGKNGIMIHGQSVNNSILGCTINCSETNTLNSVGIGIFGDSLGAVISDNFTEGVMIANCLIAFFETNILCIGSNHNYINNNIIDFSKKFGIRCVSNAIINGSGHTINSNWIALDGDGAVGIKGENNFTLTNDDGMRVSNNHFYAYSTRQVETGIDFSGTNKFHDIITGNTFDGLGSFKNGIIGHTGGHQIATSNSMHGAGFTTKIKNIDILMANY